MVFTIIFSVQLNFGRTWQKNQTVTRSCTENIKLVSYIQWYPHGIFIKWYDTINQHSFPNDAIVLVRGQRDLPAGHSWMRQSHQLSTECSLCHSLQIPCLCPDIQTISTFEKNLWWFENVWYIPTESTIWCFLVPWYPHYPQWFRYPQQHWPFGHRPGSTCHGWSWTGAAWISRADG